MTSRISFSKQLREELKHHLLSVFVVILYLIIDLLLFYFEVQGYVDNGSTQRILQQNLAAIVSPRTANMVPVMILAVLMAGEYFSFLHSRKKSDFYMSLPIKRENQIMMGASVCGILFLASCIVEIAGKVAMIFVAGAGTMTALYNAAWSLAYSILIYAVIWITMVLAMVLTGNIIIAILGFGAFCSYFTLFIRWLIPTFQEMFFETFVQSFENFNIWNYLSPVGLAIGLLGRTWPFEVRWNYLFAAAIYFIVITVLTVILYKKRPAEAAGRAMAFEKINPVVRFVVVIPLALYCGYFLSQMTMTDSKLWLVGGTVFGVVLLHGIMESIFAFDLRAMFGKKKQMGVTVILCLSFILAFQLNIEKYNTFIPEENEVETIEVELETNGNYFYQSNWADEDKYGVTGENVKVLLALAENAINQQDGVANAKNTNSMGWFLGLNDTASMEKELLSEGSNYGYITLKYRMKNGYRTARCYNVDWNNKANRAFLDIVFSTEDFKNDYYRLYSADIEQITEMALRYKLKEEKLLFTREEKEKFVEIYQKELAELSYTDMLEADAIANMQIQYENKYQENLCIYENFEETIAFIKDYGIELERPFAECEIVRLTIWNDEWEKDITIDDSKVLNEIKEKLVMRDYYETAEYTHMLPNTTWGQAEIRIDGKYDSRDVLVRAPELVKLKESMK